MVAAAMEEVRPARAARSRRMHLGRGLRRPTRPMALWQVLDGPRPHARTPRPPRRHPTLPTPNVRHTIGGGKHPCGMRGDPLGGGVPNSRRHRRHSPGRARLGPPSATPLRSSMDHRRSRGLGGRAQHRTTASPRTVRWQAAAGPSPGCCRGTRNGAGARLANAKEGTGGATKAELRCARRLRRGAPLCAGPAMRQHQLRTHARASRSLARTSPAHPFGCRLQRRQPQTRGARCRKRRRPR
mmetsp:Transcript_84521/g.273730  ORF Transcript_84521/g.273730 Transcript_84521/m.273730 type:complete len:241 (+) Transcript_84521:990-1712(+)